MNQKTNKTGPSDPVVREAHSWRMRLADPMISADVRTDFDVWLSADARNREAFGRAEIIVDALGTLSDRDLDPRLLELSAAERELQSPSSGASWRLGRRYWVGGVAVAFLMLIAGVFLLGGLRSAVEYPTPLKQALTTEIGEIRIEQLFDGSKVTLGALTHIEIEYGVRSRHVELIQGDALFDVSADIARPFVVTAGSTRARVMGTRFDVRNNGGVSRVGVVEGLVEVSHPIVIGGEPSSLDRYLELSAGQQVMAGETRGLSDILDIAPESVGAWRDARLVYFRAPLSEVIADANRYIKQNVLLDDPTNALVAESVSASFDGKNIDQMLATLSEILPVVIDRTEPDQIVIRYEMNR